MDLETRSAQMWPDGSFELRAASDGLTFEGYAAVFNVPSLRMSFPNVRSGQPFREVIRAGAFTKALAAKPDMLLVTQHDLNAIPLGRTRAGTMELVQDARGLKVRATLPDNEHGRPIRDAIARGDISGMSFRFSSVRDEWNRSADGVTQRDLHEVNLGPEVSIVSFPAYPDTSVSVRHLQVAAVDVDSVLRTLRETGRVTAEQRAVLLAVLVR